MWNSLGCFCRRKKVECVPIVEEKVIEEIVSNKIIEEKVVESIECPKLIGKMEGENDKKQNTIHYVRYSEDAETWKIYDAIKVASLEFQKSMQTLLNKHLNDKYLLSVYIYTTNKIKNFNYADCDYEFIITINDTSHHIMISDKELFNLIVRLSKKNSKKIVRPYMDNNYNLIHYFKRRFFYNPFKKQKRAEDMIRTQYYYTNKCEKTDVNDINNMIISFSYLG
jgi:hypothetical protein